FMLRPPPSASPFPYTTLFRSLCGSELNCEVHHIRKLADLNRPGQKVKPLWVKRMAVRRRKTLVVCQKCHEEIHRERPSRRKSAEDRKSTRLNSSHVEN